MGRDKPMVAEGVPQLPMSRDVFVGREAPLARLSTWLGGAPGLLTILGPGGAGKTRLSLHFAHKSVSSVPVAFCDLSAARDADGLLAALARGLDQPLGRTRSEEALSSLADYLSGWTSGLVIIDNAEHLIDESAEALTAFMAAAPALHFLVTSRHPLQLRGEGLLTLGALSLESAETLLRSRQPLLGQSGSPQVYRRIWQSLDGLPLALEMAAGRAKLLSLEALADRLEGDIGLLRTPHRDVPERHRTMAAAVAWSLSLLSPIESQVLLQCAVFRGAFGLKEAEALVRVEGVQGGEELLFVLESLQAHSLIRLVDGPGERRMGLYQAAREAALKACRAEGLEAEVRGRHAAYFSRLAPTSPSPSMLSEWRRHKDRASLEIDEIRALLDYAHKVPPDQVARGALTFVGVVYPEGRLGTWREATRRLAACRGLKGMDDALRCRIMLYEMTLLVELTEVSKAMAVLEEALALLESSKLPELAPWVWLRQGTIASLAVDMDLSLRSLNAAIQAFEERGADMGLGRAYGALGYLFRRANRIEEAREAFLKGEVYARRAQDTSTLGKFLANIAYVELVSGRIDACIAAAQQAAHLMAEMGDEFHRVHAQNIQWEALVEAGRLDEARAGLLASIERRRAENLEDIDPSPQSNLARILLLEGRLVEAEAALGEVIHAFGVIGNPQSGDYFLGFQGLALGMMGRYGLAQALLGRAAQACTANQDIMGAVYGYLGGAIVHICQSEPDYVDHAVAAACDIAEGHPSVAAPGVPLLGEAIRALVGLAEAAANKHTEPGLRQQLIEGGRAALRAAGFPPEAVVKGRERRPIEADAGMRLLAQWLDRLLPHPRGDAATPPRAQVVSQAPGGEGGALLLGPEGRWFRFGGGPPVNLGRRHAIRRILWDLVRRHGEEGGPLGLYDAFDVGWPGQQIGPEAAAHRVYVAISTLRKLGLDGVLLTWEEGYRLDPQLQIHHRQAP